MPITDKNAVTQGLANIKLESLQLPEDVLELIRRALADGSIDTSDILDYLRG